MARILNRLLGGAALTLLLAASPAGATTYFVAGTGGVTTGSNANACTDWVSPCATIAGALGKTTPTVIAVDSTGAFVAGSAITWALPGVPIAIISATNPSSGTTITPAAGASESNGSLNSAFNITCAGPTQAYISGMTIIAGSGGSSASIGIGGTSGVFGCSVEYVGGTMTLAGTNNGTAISISGVSSHDGTIFRSVGTTFSTSGSRTGNVFVLSNGTYEFVSPIFSFAGSPGSSPTALFVNNTGFAFPNLIVRDGDISGFATTGGNLIGVSVYWHGVALFKDLKLASGIGLAPSGAFGTGNPGSMTFRNVDSGNNYTQFMYIDQGGTMTVDTSNYMSTGAAMNGTNVAWKLVSTSSANQQEPFCTPPVEFWNTTLTSQTLKLEIAQNSAATALTDLQAWATLVYPNSSSFPASYTRVSDRNAAPITGTGSNQPTSSVGWTGLTTPTKQFLSNTFTAAANGLIQVRACLAAASTTMWVNPGLTQ